VDRVFLDWELQTPLHLYAVVRTHPCGWEEHWMFPWMTQWATEVWLAWIIPPASHIAFPTILHTIEGFSLIGVRALDSSLPIRLETDCQKLPPHCSIGAGPGVYWGAIAAADTPVGSILLVDSSYPITAPAKGKIANAAIAHAAPHLRLVPR
jgi:hypothetical protein